MTAPEEQREVWADFAEIRSWRETSTAADFGEIGPHFGHHVFITFGQFVQPLVSMPGVATTVSFPGAPSSRMSSGEAEWPRFRTVR